MTYNHSRIIPTNHNHLTNPRKMRIRTHLERLTAVLANIEVQMIVLAGVVLVRPMFADCVN